MIILAMLLLTNAAVDGERPICRITGGEVVPTAQVALELGSAILHGRQSLEESARYTLSVHQAGNDAWDVTQSVPDRPGPNGGILVTDGGGTVIRIDRCNGTVRFIQPII